MHKPQCITGAQATDSSLQQQATVQLGRCAVGVLGGARLKRGGEGKCNVTPRLGGVGIWPSDQLAFRP
eukprot:CAMPEP_0181223958 /NCGR_PEP_ID=MMETSP1096-20121128/30847_1 /TAXON_ID=156174 ORGANISM="Chrysochromulina ericina, Strain CCMP281" /NCGR_SAMPLE_ID=MMETSP1096 /ASSEMBLY_ACC=CAM_ASM_000453 /LENGTH=67 /DNA_ID=CAMNT_0023316961 /DNA_START=619 /DNA_END=819 /DNA_ORIENTATION=+